MTWQEQGACWGSFLDVFFPDVGSAAPKLARVICSTCVVTDDCLKYALETRPQHGVWGGRTQRELRELRRELQQ